MKTLPLPRHWGLFLVAVSFLADITNSGCALEPGGPSHTAVHTASRATMSEKGSDADIVLSDLGPSTQEQTAIKSMIAQRILMPTSAGAFRPQEPMTLGEFSLAMQRMFALPTPDKEIPFSDLSPDSDLYSAVQATAPYMGRQLLCFGCALGTNFFPSQPLPRDISTMTVVRILLSKNKITLIDSSEVEATLDQFQDTKMLSKPSRPYFATAIKTGILNSRTGAIQLTTAVSRAETALLLHNVQTRFNIPRLK